MPGERHAIASSAVVVEPYPLQRARMRDILSSELDIDVLHATGDLASLVQWLRPRSREAWPRLVVVATHQAADHGRLRAALRPLRAHGVRVVAVVGVPDHPGTPRVPVDVLDGAVAVDDPEDVFTRTVRAVAAGATVRTARARRTISGPTQAPRLSVQEQRVLTLYASGRTLGDVASEIGVREDTARVYLRRVRAKYRAVGRAASTKVDLARIAWLDGYLSDPREDRS